MARTGITAVAITDTGYNLTDSAGFTTMSTGAGNGVSFAQAGSDRIVLKNDTGGAAVFNFIDDTGTTSLLQLLSEAFA